MNQENNDNVVPLRPPSKFTPQARAKIASQAQASILENVYCVNCHDAVSILLASAKMEQDSLVLVGTCKTCGGKVCRLVEAEE